MTNPGTHTCSAATRSCRPAASSWLRVGKGSSACRPCCACRRSPASPPSSPSSPSSTSFPSAAPCCAAPFRRPLRDARPSRGPERLLLRASAAGAAGGDAAAAATAHAASSAANTLGSSHEPRGRRLPRGAKRSCLATTCTHRARAAMHSRTDPAYYIINMAGTSRIGFVGPDGRDTGPPLSNDTEAATAGQDLKKQGGGRRTGPGPGSGTALALALALWGSWRWTRRGRRTHLEAAPLPHRRQQRAATQVLQLACSGHHACGHAGERAGRMNGA